MIELLVEFSKPYGVFSVTAAAGFVHNLEGAIGGLIFRGPYLDASSPLKLFTAACLSALVISFLLSLITAWRYSRALFVLVLACWLTPGFVELEYPGAFKSWFVPDFEFWVWGAPSLRPPGSTSELISAMSILFLLGWSITSLLAGVFLAGKRFRLVFDHIWLPVGLTAAVFVVWDSNTAQLRENIATIDRTAIKVVTVFDERLVRLNALCAHEEMQSISSRKTSVELCNWAHGAHKKMVDLKYSDDFARVGIVFPTSEEFFSYGGDYNDQTLAQKIIADLAKLDSQLCAIKDERMPCEEIPGSLASQLISRGITASVSDAFRPRALPAVELAFLLNKVTANGGSLFDQLREAIGVSNRRWLSFVLIAFVAGAKAALSTREIYRDDLGNPFKKGKWGPTLFTNTPIRLWRIAKQVGLLARVTGRITVSTLKAMLRACSMAIRAAGKIRESYFS